LLLASVTEAATDRWSKDILEPTIRSSKAGLVHSIYETPEEMPGDIRPRQEFKGLTEALQREVRMGWPDAPITVAF
jgi:hypothetical protein